jgi:hypothetical protein
MGLGSGIRDPEKTYSGSQIRVQGQKGTGSRIRIRSTGLPVHSRWTFTNNNYLKIHCFAISREGSGSV